MSRDDLLLRDCAACAGTILGGAIFYIGAIMAVAASVGFLFEAIDHGLGLETELSWKIALAVAGVTSAVLGYRTYAICHDELPEIVLRISGIVRVLAVITLVTIVAFAGLASIFGYVWAAAIIAAWLAWVSIKKTPTMFRL